MIRFRIGELVAAKEFREGRRITLTEVAAATGVNRMTISRMINTKGYNAGSDTLDGLCRYFGCGVGDLAIYIPDEDAKADQTGHKTEGRFEASDAPTR
jgi:putative transcriptional regulator